MTQSGTWNGRLIFFILLLIVFVIAISAYQFSGPMGIEERFTHALGMDPSDDEGNSGLFGFVLEGSPLLYGIVLGILAVGIVLTYRHFRL